MLIIFQCDYFEFVFLQMMNPGLREEDTPDRPKKPSLLGRNCKLILSPYIAMIQGILKTSFLPSYLSPHPLQFSLCDVCVCMFYVCKVIGFVD